MKHFNIKISLCHFGFVIQGNNIRKVQPNERREPGDCLRSDSHAASGAECFDNPEWHETTETGGAAHHRTWRCLILRLRPVELEAMDNYLFCQRGKSSQLCLSEDWNVCDQTELETILFFFFCMMDLVGFDITVRLGFASAKSTIFFIWGNSYVFYFVYIVCSLCL